MMRKLQILAVCAVLLAASAPAWPQAAEADLPRRYKELEFPPLRPFSPPEPSRHELSNGIVVFLLEDHALPIVDLAGSLRVGAVREPREKAGLASICGTVMRTGGTAEWPGDALDEELEQRAMSLEIDFGEEQGSVSLSVMKDDLERALEVLAGVLRRPAFPQEKLDLEKRAALSIIARRNDNPGAIASREFRKRLYGPDAPWSREADPKTIGRIAREDLLAFHEGFVGPDSLVLGIWGDFESEALLAALERHLGDWEPSGRSPPAVAAPDTEVVAPLLGLVSREDVNQSSITMGHFGITRRPKDPDYPALVVMNSILGGGGFASRLFQKVRTEEGLAYSVYSHFAAPLSHPGLFAIGVQTKSESTVAAIRSIIAELRRIQDEPVDEQELRIAKDAFLNSLVFAFDSRAELIGRRIFYEFEGWPTDHLQWMVAAVEAVTVEQVQASARAYLHPDHLSIVVAGNPGEFDEALDVLAAEGQELQELDIELAPFEVQGEEQAAEVQASPERLARGRAVAARCLEAMGGAETVEAIRSLVVEAEALLRDPQGTLPASFTYKMRFPDKLRIEFLTPMGVVRQAVNGSGGWIAQGPMVADMPPSQAEDLRERVERSDYRLIPALASGELEAVYLGEEEEQHVLRAGLPDGGSLRLYFDAGSGLLVRREQETPVGLSVTRFADHRQVDGVLCPFLVIGSMNGEETQRLEVKSTRLNVDLPDTEFARPEGEAPGGGGGG